MNDWLGEKLHRLADRISPRHARRVLSISFTFEKGEGLRVRNDGKGCPLAYLNWDDYDRAYTESDTKPMRIDWATMKLMEY